MKFTVQSKPFAAALAIAGRVIPAKAPWPVVMNIYMSAADGVLTLRGTSMDMTYEADVPAEVATAGLAMIDYATLAKFFSAARGDSLSVEVDSGGAVIRCGRGRIALSAVNASDFPNIRPPAGDPVTMDRDTLLQALRFCAAAVSPSEQKYHIAGVNIAEAEGWLDFWGTDARIAHHARMVGIGQVGGGGQLPMDAVAVICGIAEKADAVKFLISDTGWHIDAGAIRAWGKVIDAKYPDMDRALSAFKDWTDIAIVDRSAMAQALDVAVCGADTGSDKTRHVVLRSDSTLTLRGHRPAGGTVTAGRAEVDADVRGATAIALNADYVRATLGAIAADSVTVRATVDAIRIEPQQSSETLPLQSTIFCIRASEAELADV